MKYKSFKHSSGSSSFNPTPNYYYGISQNQEDHCCCTHHSRGWRYQTPEQARQELKALGLYLLIMLLLVIAYCKISRIPAVPRFFSWLLRKLF